MAVNLREIACICLLLCVCALTCEGGYRRKKPPGCYSSRRQCEAKCCCTGKRCEPTTSGGRRYYKCVTVDCGSLSDPANGYVSHLGGTTFESLAEYRCNSGYILSYPAGRTCLSSGLWSATAPRCEPEPICMEEECPLLEPPCNGILDVPVKPIPGNVATYDCVVGFELIGNNTRICQEDHTWDGIPPCCQQAVAKTCREMSEYANEHQGSTYRFIDDTFYNWEDAKMNCEADGAKLVEIGSQSEQTHLDSLLTAGSTFWLTNGNDLANEGTWVWPIDGGDISGADPSQYTNWNIGEPSGGSKQNCLAIYKPYNGWSDIGCIVNAYSICECTVEEDLDLSNGVYPDQDRCFVGTELRTNCLQRVSAENKSRRWQEE